MISPFAIGKTFHSVGLKGFILAYLGVFASAAAAADEFCVSAVCVCVRSQLEYFTHKLFFT